MSRSLVQLFVAASLAASASATSCGTFSSKATLTRATAFTLTWEDHAGDELAVIDMPESGDRPALQYVFTKCTDLTAARAAYPDAIVLTSGPKPVSADQTPIAAFLDELDEHTALVSYRDHSLVYSDRVTTHLAASSATDHSQSWSSNYTALAAAGADVHFTGTGNYNSASAALTEFGQADRIVVIGEQLEAHPIGRAEWIHVVGIALGAEAAAHTKCTEIITSYNLAKTFAGSVTEAPSVWNGGYFGAPYYTETTWFPPALTTYWAHFLADAKSTYTVPSSYVQGAGMSMAEALPYAQDAQFWIAPSKGLADVPAYTADESTLASFRSVQCANIWDNDNRKKPGLFGANDFFEAGVVRPDKVLMDMIKVLHPDMLPDYELYFFRQAPKGASTLSCPDDAAADEAADEDEKSNKKKDDDDEEEDDDDADVDAEAIADEPLNATMLGVVVALSCLVVIVGGLVGFVCFRRGRAIATNDAVMEVKVAA
mmetsp:Transcript_22812/g.67213  ORF Transcript_22812/g.67213 Transcript_22812/m.67213 type:complete len:486 (+) Transcript_22812:28-1485(+)